MATANVTLRTKDGGEYQLPPDRIATNAVVLPGEPYGRERLWVIGNEYGPLGAVWASNMQDAFDTLVDEDLGAGLLVDEESLKAMSEEEAEALDALGNAGEPADLTYAWANEVAWEPARDWFLLAKLAEARGASAERLSDVI